MSAATGLVLVSHSAALAAGLRELVAQMAPSVPIGVAGGTDEGELGTSADRVLAAIEQADAGAGVAVLYDLGSARMSAELALDMAADPDAVRIVDAPFVEGALEAGVAAEGGRSLDDVVAAARSAAGAEEPPAPGPPAGAGTAERRTVRLTDPAGLHARPAAAVLRALAGRSADVRMVAEDGRAAAAGSVTGLLRLALPAGATVTVEATGPDAATAADRVVEALAVPPEPADGPPEPAAPAAGAAEGEVRGLPAAPGTVAGPLHRIRPAEVRVPDEEYRGERTERDRLDAALAAVRGELSGPSGASAASPAGGIADAHLGLLADPELTGDARARIGAGEPAAAAWWGAVGDAAGALAGVADPLIASRAEDVIDVGRRVLTALTGETEPVRVPAGAVVLAGELAPSMVPALAEGGAAALLLRAGGARSHAAVLARSAGLPMVVGLADRMDAVTDATTVLVDGAAGAVRVDPPAEALAAAGGADRAETAAGPVRGPDGREVLIAANVGSAADARAATGAGADGVGLLRTELLFTGRQDLPGEDEQVGWLSAILAACPPGPVVVRTVDLGGDKPMPALRLDPARNGFLGRRGLRLCLAMPELFRAHLRAVLRAGAVRPLELMFPFVTEPAELAAARAALRAAADELAAEGVDHRWPERIGIMVEIPTSAVDVRPFLPDAEFLSVGSNDLAQYLAAADRTLDLVDGAYRAGERLVPDLVAGLCAAAGEGVPVAVCGDLAGDPEYAARFVAAGVAELSVAAPLVPRLRAALGVGGRG